MFKTTPRSILMGGNLIIKSAMRLRVNEDGTLSRHTDTLTEEDLAEFGGGVPDPYNKGGMIDRAPTGSGPGHYHMIDALLEAMLRLSEKNGFERTKELKNIYIRAIDHFIHQRNLKVKEIEGPDSPNILSRFTSPRWRTNVIAPHIKESEAKKYGGLLPVVQHSRHGERTINDMGRDVTTGRQVTAFGKKGTIDDPKADQGNSIDSLFNPISNEIGSGLDEIAPLIKQHLGISEGQRGPLDGHQTDKAISRFTRSHILNLQHSSTGTVFTLTEREMNDLGEGILPQSVIRHYREHQGKPYVAAEPHDSEFDTTHSGAAIPAYALEREDRTGTPKGKGAYDRLAAMKRLLQSVIGDEEKGIAGMEHVSPETKEIARDLLAREETEGALTANITSPKLSALFGVGTWSSEERRQGLKDARTKVSKRIDRGVSNPRFLGYLEKLNKKHGLGLTRQDIVNAGSNLAPSNTAKDTTGQGAARAGHKFHALHAAIQNKLRDQGHPEPHAEARRIIEGRDEQGNLTLDNLDKAGNLAQVEDAFKMLKVYNEAFQHQVPYRETGITKDPKDMGWFYDTQRDTASTGILPSLYGEFTGTGDINTIQQSFETLQTMSAIKDDRVMKHVKKGYSLNSYNDIRSFATSVGLTSQDVYGIMATKGDWNVVAKQWNVSPMIVKATKVTFGGA